MTLVAWNRGSSIVLEANPSYWGGSRSQQRQRQDHRRQLGPGPGLRGRRPRRHPVAALAQDIKRLQADERFGNVISRASASPTSTSTPRIRCWRARDAPGLHDADRPADHRERHLSGRRQGRELDPAAVVLGLLARRQAAGVQRRGRKSLFNVGGLEGHRRGRHPRQGRQTADRHPFDAQRGSATACRPSSSCRRSSNPPASTRRRRSPTGPRSPPTTSRRASTRSPCSAGSTSSIPYRLIFGAADDRRLDELGRLFEPRTRRAPEAGPLGARRRASGPTPIGRPRRSWPRCPTPSSRIRAISSSPRRSCPSRSSRPRGATCGA